MLSQDMEKCSRSKEAKTEFGKIYIKKWSFSAGNRRNLRLQQNKKIRSAIFGQPRSMRVTIPCRKYGR